MRLFFVLNPSKRSLQWDYREMAARQAQRAGSSARFGQVDRTNPRSLELLLRQAADEGCERIVVLGGDGTLNRTINLLHRQKSLADTEVAVVPAGTCNDFARAVGLFPKRLDENLAIACNGTARPTDLGRMDDRLFLNNAGFGRRPQVAGARKTLRPLKTLRSFQPTPLRIEWEKGSIEGAFFMALVCNAPFFSGGLYFSKLARVNDGLLDVYLVPMMPKWRLLPLLMIGRLGRSVKSRQMVTLRVQELLLEASSGLWPQADGEPPAAETRRVHFSIAREQVRMVVPMTASTVSLYI